MDKNYIKKVLLSNEHIQEISLAGNWITTHHSGSKVLDYFLDEGYELEYGDSRQRKAIIKAYLTKRIESILKGLEELIHTTLYRAIYTLKVPSKDMGQYGLFWSLRANTAPCVMIPSVNHIEVLLSIKLDSSKINWLETVRSRLDPLFGDKEEEIQLLPNSTVDLLDIKIIQ